MRGGHKTVMGAKAALCAFWLLGGTAGADDASSEPLIGTSFCQDKQALVLLTSDAQTFLPKSAQDDLTKQLRSTLTTHHIKDACNARNKVFLIFTVDYTPKASNTSFRAFLFELEVIAEKPDGQATYVNLWRNNYFGYSDKNPQANLAVTTAVAKRFLDRFAGDWALAHP